MARLKTAPQQPAKIIKMKEIFFKDWTSIGHVAIATVVAIITLFLFVRISGKRTLAKLNAFDFVVTVALGSTLSYMMLNLVPLLEGAVVLMLIIFMQYLFAWTARSSTNIEHLVNAVPQLLFYDGRFVENAMKREALTEEELYAAIRHAGIDQIEQVKAIVIELNAKFQSSGRPRETEKARLMNLREPSLNSHRTSVKSPNHKNLDKFEFLQSSHFDLKPKAPVKGLRPNQQDLICLFVLNIDAENIRSHCRCFRIMAVPKLNRMKMPDPENPFCRSEF